MSVPQRLKSFLDSNQVPYESLSHSTTYTAQGTATLMQISGKEIAKTVVLCVVRKEKRRFWRFCRDQTRQIRQAGSRRRKAGAPGNGGGVQQSVPRLRTRGYAAIWRPL